MIAWSLAAVGVVWGLAASWVFRRFTNRAALRIVRKRLYAHLLEIRLYSEEPALVWNAQKAILADNIRFLKLTATPVLIMAAPFAFLYSALDSIYGFAPLVVGRAAVVTLQLPHEPGANDSQYTLRATPGIAVETPPIRVFADRQITWRIRALKPVRGRLRLGDVSRSIFAGERALSFNWPRESFPDGVWLEVDYPRADVWIAGVSLPWLAWFLIVSTASTAFFALSGLQFRKRSPRGFTPRGTDPKSAAR